MRTNVRAQGGSALLMTLIVLLLLTVASLAVARMSRTDMITLNSRQRSTALFQAADSAVDRELSIGAADIDTPRVTPSTVGTVDLDVETRFETYGEVPTGGYSLGGEFGAYHFEIRARAEDSDEGNAEIMAGFYVVGPSG
jgi:hypothetical protein